jgi:small-conductance mechanosensitive channel
VSVATRLPLTILASRKAVGDGTIAREREQLNIIQAQHDQAIKDWQHRLGEAAKEIERSVQSRPKLTTIRLQHDLSAASESRDGAHARVTGSQEALVAHAEALGRAESELADVQASLQEQLNSVTSSNLALNADVKVGDS